MQIEHWFRRVGIFPSIINQAGNDWDGIPLAKRFWKTAYRDARNYAKIACHANDELVKFRGFGVLKSIWAFNPRNCIGRIRVDDLREFDNYSIAKQLGFTDYNPNRIL